MTDLFNLPFLIVFLLAEAVVAVYFIIGIRLFVGSLNEASATKKRSAWRTLIISLLCGITIYLLYKVFMAWWDASLINP